MNKIIVIVGPTSVGKTKLSIELAKHYKAEIINADAVQVYKEPIIGSAKITEEEKCNIPHHLLNVVSLMDNYTVYDFQKEARNILNKLIKEDKNVIIVGGSGLYLKAFLYNYEFTDENEKINLFSELTNEELKNQVDKIYPQNNIHINNRKRLVRFINHYNSTKEIIESKEEKDKPLYNFVTIGLTLERDVLYSLINKRVEEMFKSGLLNEVTDLYEKGFTKINTIIGYKEFIPYFEKSICLDEVKEEIKKNTRQYSKRQMTWFNNQVKNIKWFNVNINDFNKTIKDVIKYIN